MKVYLITNDQAAELVDTSFLEYTNGIVENVSGSCFYPEIMKAFIFKGTV
jgi:hypothetical protein